MGKSFDKSYVEALLKRIETQELEVVRLKSENASLQTVKVCQEIIKAST
jgi:hypothetical protein